MTNNVISLAGQGLCGHRPLALLCPLTPHLFPGLSVQMLLMTWLLISQGLWELAEVHGYQNLNKRTSLGTQTRTGGCRT